MKRNKVSIGTYLYWSKNLASMLYSKLLLLFGVRHSTSVIPEGFNPTVGGSLYLNSLIELPEWYTTPKVGSNIFLKDYKNVLVNNKKE